MTTPTAPSAWYPQLPPSLPGETDEAYTNRLLGITAASPYDHQRNRQCSIGYHDECSDPAGERCGCPCHRDRTMALLAYGAGQARQRGGQVILEYQPVGNLWRVTVALGGIPAKTSLGRTPTAALAEALRPAGWID